jgi:WD40 repeat protein
MATLTAFNARFPLNASDDVYLTFTASTTGEVLSRAAEPTNTDVGRVDTLLWRVEAGRTTAGDDTFSLAIRVMSGATVLAAANSGGTYASVATIPTGTTADEVYGPTAFAYVNTTATAAQWAAATVELQQTYSANMGADGAAIKVDHVQFTGTYTRGVAPLLVSPADGATADGTSFSWTFQTENADTQAKYAFRRWDTAERLFTSTLPGVWQGDSSGRSVAFSPDGSLLAVGHDSSPFLTVLNTSDWSIVSGTPTLPGGSRGVVFSPDGTRLAVGHAISPLLTVLNTSNWSVVSGTPTLAGIGRGVAFSPDGSLLAVGQDTSPFLTVLNTSNWSVVSTPTLAGEGFGVAFSPDGTKLAVGHAITPFLTVLNTSNWSVVSGTPTLTGSGFGVAFSPDGTRLAVTYSTSPRCAIILTSNWSTETTLIPPGSLGFPAYGVAFSPDGSRMAVGFAVTPHLRVYNTSGWSVVSGTTTLSGSTWAVRFSPNSQLLATGNITNPPFLTVMPGGTLEYWNGTAWTTTETFITSSAQTLTLPASAWT